ncbi:MAG TPA: hypothetical protein VG759_02240, partial [Candidatus Angelobacter sp.]|nr:hypothetical protein [Candidatus Angelobacter sp.]
MSLSRPISASRTMAIMLRMALRRQLNRLRSVKPLKTGEVRSGTPAKSRRSPLLSVFLLLIFAINGLNISSRTLAELSDGVRKLSPSPDVISVSFGIKRRLVEVEEALQYAEQTSDPEQRKSSQGLWQRRLEEILLTEVRQAGLSEEQEARRLQQMRDTFARKGASGFVVPGDSNLGEAWPRTVEGEAGFFRALNVIVLLWIPLLVFLTLGMGNKDLGQVEWSFEWLYTFPASASSLFASKWLVYSFVNPLVWVFLLPFLIMAYVAGGHGFAAIPLGLVAVVYLALLAGAITTILEVILRKFLPLAQLKNVQALFTALGTICILLIYAAGFSKSLDDFLLRQSALMPEILSWSPFSLPLVFGLPSAQSWQLSVAAGGMVLSLAVFSALALLGSAWLTRDGLVKAGGPYQGSRGVRARRSGRRWMGGIAAYELLLLVRDKNLMVQVMFVPLLIPVFYLLIYSGMFSAVTGNFRHAATMAFGVGAYTYLSSAMGVLNREDKTLWQLISFPQSLPSILLKKTMVWAGTGLFYGGAVLLILVHYSQHLHGSSWGDAFFALYGVLLYAFIASGIGALATDVLAVEQRKRIKPEFVYLYMLLAGMYANVVYSPSLWIKLAQMVLSTLLAFALWQKVEDICPYLLDPVARPPRRISLADGMIAALAFFVLQRLYTVFLAVVMDESRSMQITIAYIFAGLTITFFALWSL